MPGPFVSKFMEMLVPHMQMPVALLGKESLCRVLPGAGSPVESRTIGVVFLE